jgi:hypothetical protein
MRSVWALGVVCCTGFVYAMLACDPQPPRVRSPAEEDYIAAGQRPDGGAFQRHGDPDAGPRPGEQYCRELAVDSASLGNANFVVGVGSGVVSLGALTLGTTVWSNDSSSSNSWKQNRGIILNVASVPLAVAAYYFMSRANAAYETAAQANNARVLRDKDMWKVCDSTWSAWDRSHAASDEIVRAALNEKLALQSDGGDDFPGLDGEGGPPSAPAQQRDGGAGSTMQADSGH